MWWDMLATEEDLSDARYLIRRRWTPTAQAKLLFPDKAELIGHQPAARAVRGHWRDSAGMGHRAEDAHVDVDGPAPPVRRTNAVPPQKFPYVPFWGKKEDRTGVPYGLVRGMMYMQDNVNATNSKLRWGMAAVRTTRTKGAVNGTDAQFRKEVARVDADIILNHEHMAKQVATFKVERDFELNQQQYQMLQDSRAGIQRVSGISPSLQGAQSGANSGLQEATQLEQSTQVLAEINDNFATSRAEVGDLLLSLLVEDMIGREETVRIKGDPLRPETEVRLNVPTQDDDGITYLDNDVQRTKLKVALNDVPSTPSYRSQQLSAMSEAFKAMPPQFQQVAMPYLIALMDLPNREDIIKAVREAAQQMTPEQIQGRIDEAVNQARMANARDLKQELSLRYPKEKLDAEIGKLLADSF